MQHEVISQQACISVIETASGGVGWNGVAQDIPRRMLLPLFLTFAKMSRRFAVKASLAAVCDKDVERNSSSREILSMSLLKTGCNERPTSTSQNAGKVFKQ
jgi:hypothetical protein